MLGLAEEIGGDEPGVGRLVGDDQDLRGAGEQVDPHPAEQLALGLGDERIAGPDQHVDGLEAIDEAERHRRQALHAAEGEDGVGARGLDGVEHRRVDPALALGRRAADHLLDARHLGHQDGHEGGREHRVAPAGHVGPDGVDRDVAVAEHDARPHLDLERGQRGQLGAGEPADLVLGEGDVALEVVVELGLDARVLRVGDDEVAGAHASNSSEYRRTASIPPCSMSRRICETRARSSSVASVVGGLGALR